MTKRLISLLAVLVFSSCVPSTPQARIAQNPQTFAALSKKEQQLVEQGEIARGMSPEAVILAWGKPERRFEGVKDSKRTERWDYSGLRPVYTSTFYGGFGRYRHHAYSGFGYGFGPEVAYIPDRVASVWFVNSRTDSWERLR